MAAFENKTYCSKRSAVPHSFYLPYVKFLFHTGCRPEEVVALKWKHVEETQIYFCEAMPTDVRIRKATKTDKPRHFPINPELQKILDSVQLETYHSDAVVFPAPYGKELDAHDFLNRVWKLMVTHLVEADQVKSSR
jgi:integrase